MKRIALATALLSLAVAPAVAGANPGSDSVGMTATVIESCTITMRGLDSAADEPDRSGGFAGFGCGDDLADLTSAGERERSADGVSRSYRVLYESEPSSAPGGSSRTVATIVF
jgi:hypothetical protein